MNLTNASLIGLVMAIAGLVTLVFVQSLFAAGVVGIAVQVIAAALMVWARVTFGRRSFHATADPTEGGLVTAGPYRFLRHPIYAALLYFAWAGILTHPSILTVVLGLLATAGLAIRIYAEEQLVRKRYPDYAGYAARTKRVIPYIL